MTKPPRTYAEVLRVFCGDACLRFGYCTSDAEAEALVAQADNLDPDAFVEALIRAEGLDPAERKRDHRNLRALLQDRIGNLMTQGGSI